jgi:precorrin-4 methylase
MEAVTAMSRADAFICSPDMQKQFGKYMGDKPILFDVYDFSHKEAKKKDAGLSSDEVSKTAEERKTAMADAIKAELKKGKHVAILEYGDPTVWSGSEYIMEYFDKDMFDIIPGLSSFNVASALLKKHTGCKGSIVLTTSRGILDNKPMFEAAAKNGETLSIFMAMRDIKDLVEFFNSVYKADTPVHIAYRAGYSASEKVVITNIKEMKTVIDSESEKNLFLVFVGPCLTDLAKAHRH